MFALELTKLGLTDAAFAATSDSLISRQMLMFPLSVPTIKKDSELSLIHCIDVMRQELLPVGLEMVDRLPMWLCVL